jgi:hypothetical protein
VNNRIEQGADPGEKKEKKVHKVFGELEKLLNFAPR